MATTALNINGKRLKIMTRPVPVSKKDDIEDIKVFTEVTLYECDDDFMPVIIGAVTVHENDEETYHRELRVASFNEGHFVPDQSTDYKWNPGYNPEEDTNDGSETAL
jgi:hypothetical protein